MCECSVFPVIDLPRTGRNIRRLREEAGVTVRDLQAYFGFEYPQAIYKWQHGECLPSVDNLLALSRVLRVPMEDLLVYDDQEVSFARMINHGFNDKSPDICYYISIDREHKVPAKKSGREPTSVSAAFPAGIRRTQQRCQRVHYQETEIRHRPTEQARARSCDPLHASTTNHSERSAPQWRG